MGANSILVDPVKVKEVANKIGVSNGLAREYHQSYEKMFSEIDDLSAAYQSDDYNELKKRADSFRMDFDSMYKIFESYETFLNQVANDYQKAENDTLADAKNRLKM